jgi:hypothetical protein
MLMTKLTGKAYLLTCALASLPCASAHASQVAVIDGLTVTDYGEVNPGGPIYTQPSGTVSAGGTAQIQLGQPGTSNGFNPPELGNPGWDTYGQAPGYTADNTHYWWNVESGSVTFDLSGDSLDMVWGSPNNGSEGSPAYGDDNYVTFYNGANAIGTIEAGDLYSDFNGVCNCQSPGYLLSIALPKGETYTSVVFGTTPSDFEFTITQSVPEPSTWAMMLLGFAGLGYAGFRKSHETVRALV